MMISPWRSAKWPGTSFQPSCPNRSGPPMSSRIASAQSAPCSFVSAADAANSNPTPSVVETIRPLTALRKSGVSRDAIQKRISCA